MEVDGDALLAGRIYDSLLASAFPADELEDRDAFVGAFSRDDAKVTALVFTRDGEPVAAIVGYRYVQGQVLLIGYLAVRQDLRGCQLGSRLLSAARARWSSAERTVIVAEVEAAGRSSSAPARCRPEAYGDPARRLLFYQRNDARAINRPYFQPRMRPGFPRVHGLMLVVLPAPNSSAPALRILSEPVVCFLQEYFADSEGIAARDDEETRGLLERYSEAEYLDLVPLDRYLPRAPSSPAE